MREAASGSRQLAQQRVGWLYTVLCCVCRWTGQGVQSTGPHQLEKDQVVKVGACSLQVTDTCVESRRPDVAVSDSKM